MVSAKRKRQKADASKKWRQKNPDAYHAFVRRWHLVRKLAWEWVQTNHPEVVGRCRLEAAEIMKLKSLQELRKENQS